MTQGANPKPDVPEDTLETVETIQSILKAKGNNIWSISPDATVFEAVKVMGDKSVGALIVVERGSLAGILSERDYARKVILKGRSSKKALVSEVMSTPVITVEPNRTVVECMRLMTAHRIRHLPVLEGGTIVGVISIGDLVNSIISEQVKTIRHLQDYVTGKYPG